MKNDPGAHSLPLRLSVWSTLWVPSQRLRAVGGWTRPRKPMVKLEGSSGACMEAPSRGGGLGALSRAGLVRESFQEWQAGSTSDLSWEAWGRVVSHKHPGTIPSSSPQRQSPAGSSSYTSTCRSTAISFSPSLLGKPESSIWPPALPSSALTFPGPSPSLSCLVSSIS